MSEALKIAVLYGGISSEREISLLSGQNVADALKSKGHDVQLIDTKEKSQIQKLLTENFDIAYIALHGKGGEDGSIQGFLETIALPYTGSKIQASATAMSKAASKLVYERANIPTPPGIIIDKATDCDLSDEKNFPDLDVVVKASSEGSSIGLYFAQGLNQIVQAVKKAQQFDDTVVVEKRIPGREFTVAVIDFSPEKQREFVNKLTFHENSAALPVIEIIPKNEFYDFESKYDEGGSQHICPAQIDEALKTQLQNLAITAHKALGCEGFSRTDFRVSEEGKPFALETNTIPGMTSKSLVPDAARSIGINFEDLCDAIVRHSYNVNI